MRSNERLKSIRAMRTRSRMGIGPDVCRRDQRSDRIAPAGAQARSHTEPTYLFDLEIAYYLAAGTMTCCASRTSASRAIRISRSSTHSAAAAAQSGRKNEAAQYAEAVRQKLPTLNLEFDELAVQRTPAHAASLREELKLAELLIAIPTGLATATRLEKFLSAVLHRGIGTASRPGPAVLRTDTAAVLHQPVFRLTLHLHTLRDRGGAQVAVLR